MTYPNGRVLYYSYGTPGSVDDAISRLSALVDDDGATSFESYLYLGDGTVVQRANPASTLTYIHQAGDTLTSLSDGGDPYTGLDRFGRVVDAWWLNTADLQAGNLTSAQLIAATTDRFRYTYDQDSNVRSSVDDVDVANAPAMETFIYDGLNRLTSAAGGLIGGAADGSQDWTLDDVGNMTGVLTDGTTTTDDTRTFNTLNQVTPSSTVNGQASKLAYDANGNTIVDQQGYTMVYDAWNRLTQVLGTDGATLLESYSYNGQGYRITQTITAAGVTAAAASGQSGVVAGTVDLYYSSQWQVLEEQRTVNSTTTTTAQFVWSPVYVNALVCQDSAVIGQTGNWGKSNSGMTQRLFFQQDANFNVTAAVGYSFANRTWNVAQRMVDDPYGKQFVVSSDWTVTSDAVLTLRSFQGGLLDQITGNINFDYRDYNPATMTWNTQDPLVFADGVNRYRPMGNNPIHFTDPNGEYLQVVIGAGVGFLWGGVGALIAGGDLKSVIAGGLGGATTGALISIGVPPCVAGMAGSAAGSVLDQSFHGQNPFAPANALKTGVAGTLGWFSGSLTKSIADKVENKIFTEVMNQAASLTAGLWSEATNKYVDAAIGVYEKAKKMLEDHAKDIDHAASKCGDDLEVFTYLEEWPPRKDNAQVLTKIRTEVRHGIIMLGGLYKCTVTIYRNASGYEMGFIADMSKDE
jgi:RHS repeat-associated protein